MSDSGVKNYFFVLFADVVVAAQILMVICIPTGYFLQVHAKMEHALGVLGLVFCATFI